MLLPVVVLFATLLPPVGVCWIVEDGGGAVEVEGIVDNTDAALEAGEEDVEKAMLMGDN